MPRKSASALAFDALRKAKNDYLRTTGKCPKAIYVSNHFFKRLAHEVVNHVHYEAKTNTVKLFNLPFRVDEALRNDSFRFEPMKREV